MVVGADLEARPLSGEARPVLFVASFLTSFLQEVHGFFLLSCNHTVKCAEIEWLVPRNNSALEPGDSLRKCCRTLEY